VHYIKEIKRSSVLLNTELDLALSDKIIHGVDGCGKPLEREEGGEVCGVGGDGNECEEPPGTR